MCYSKTFSSKNFQKKKKNQKREDLKTKYNLPINLFHIIKLYSKIQLNSIKKNIQKQIKSLKKIKQFK